MKIEIVRNADTVGIRAIDAEIGLVSIGQGAALTDAVRSLIARFAEMQDRTIEALGELGITVHLPRHPEDVS